MDAEIGAAGGAARARPVADRRAAAAPRRGRRRSWPDAVERLGRGAGGLSGRAARPRGPRGATSRRRAARCSGRQRRDRAAARRSSSAASARERVAEMLGAAGRRGGRSPRSSAKHSPTARLAAEEGPRTSARRLSTRRAPPSATMHEAAPRRPRREHEALAARAPRRREHDLAGLTARLRSLEELDASRAGFGDAARVVLAQANGAVDQLGAVADYLDVDRRYERAVEALLGDLLQHVDRAARTRMRPPVSQLVRAARCRAAAASSCSRPRTTRGEPGRRRGACGRSRASRAPLGRTRRGHVQPRCFGERVDRRSLTRRPSAPLRAQRRGRAHRRR